MKAKKGFFVWALLAAGVSAGEKLPEACERALERCKVVFDKPNGAPTMKPFRTGRPEQAMPFGAGNLSGMVSFGTDTLEVHLSRADYLALDSAGGLGLLSPGHVSVRFPDLGKDFAFRQIMDMRNGEVKVSLTTPRGRIDCSLTGERKTGALLIRVDDSRASRVPAVVSYDNIRTRSLKTSAGLQTDGRTFWRLLEDHEVSGRHYATLVTTGDTSSNFCVRVVSTCADSTQRAVKAAEAKMSALKRMKKDDIDKARIDWWTKYWSRGWIDIGGDDRAAFLERCWYVNLYAWANVGYGDFPPKFNGGPGLIFNDSRCWGAGFWYQNTRELIWPQCAAGHADFAKRLLDCYDSFLPRARADHMKSKRDSLLGGFRLPETTPITYSPLADRKAPVERPDWKRPYTRVGAEERRKAREARIRAHGTFTGHVFSSGTELLQQMFDYVRYTGDKSYLPVVATWLREQTELYLSLLEKADDGLYHIYCTNVNESWFKKDDSIVDLAAARFCLQQTVAQAKTFGYPEELVADAKDRLASLAPLPTLGSYKYELNWSCKISEVREGDTLWQPYRSLTNGTTKSNCEVNQLYLVFPFAMAHADHPEDDPVRRRAVATFWHLLPTDRVCNGYGWSPVGIDAVRLHLTNAVDVVYAHAVKTCKWPFGGGRSPASRMYPGSPVEDAPYFDGTGVIQTSLQEILLQSHAEEPDAGLFTGGAVKLVPEVPASWRGSYRLHARGGFAVECSFEGRRVVSCRVTSTRGGDFRYIDPVTGEEKTRKTKPRETFMLPAPAAAMAPGDFHAKDLTPIKGEKILPGGPVELVSPDGKTALPIVCEIVRKSARDRGETWASRCLSYAAADFQDYIFRLTGTKPAVIRWEKGSRLPVKNAVFIGEDFSSVMPGLPKADVKAEEFAVAARGGSIWITGDARHGVSDFCERILGAREYYSSKEGGSYLPPRRPGGLAVPRLEWRDRPVFEMRVNYPYDNERWGRMLKNSTLSRRGAPRLNVHAPYAKWFTDTNLALRAKSPEIFQLDSNGERNVGGELCYGNPKTLEVYKRMIDIGIATTNTMHGILSFPDRSVTVSQRDNAISCHCADCKRLYDPKAGAKGIASPAIWGFFTRALSDWLAKAHPGWTIVILPYINTEDCPKGLVFPAKNVVAEVCLTAGLANFKTPSIREASEKRIMDWRRATGRPVQLWHYSIWPAQFTSAPYVYGETVTGHYRRMKNDVSGTMINGPFALNRYVLSIQVWMRALWNPMIDPKGVYDGYCTKMFGPAAGPMREIAALEEKCWNRPWSSGVCSVKHVHGICYPRKDVERILALFAEAEKLAAADKRAAKNVAWYKAGFKDLFKESQDIAEGRGKEPVRIQKVAELPVIDGKLDDGAWSAAVPVKFIPGHTYRKVYKKNPAPEFGGTEMRAVWNRNGVVFGFRCEEKTKKFSCKRPLGSFENETFDIFLDPSGTGAHPPRQLVADPQGTWAVCELSNWKAPKAKAAFAFDEKKGEYCAEIFVAYDDLRDYPGGRFPVLTADGIRWSGNITRWRIGDPSLPQKQRKFEATRIWTSGTWDNADCRGFGEFIFTE